MENFSAAEEYYDYLLNPFEMVLLSSDEAHDNGVDQLLSLQDCEINAQLSNIFLAPELQVEWPQPLPIHDINHGSFLCPSRFEGSDLPFPTPSQLPVTEPVEEVGSCNQINSAEEKKRTEDGNAVESSPVHGNSIKQIKADHFCSHPLFIRFLTGHIECCKVGVYDQTVVAQLDQLIDEYTRVLSNKSISSGSRPDLDQFMVAYCSMLESYREELNHTFEETKEFLKTLEKRVAEMRMGDVKEVKEGMQSAVPRQRFQAMDMEVKLQATIDAMMEDGLPSLLNIQMSQSQIAQVTMEVKEAMNMQRARKFSRLPEDATKILQDWWEKSHETNPYPSKNDKLEFARCTGLEPKQIENWFSNQRKKSCATRGIF